MKSFLKFKQSFYIIAESTATTLLLLTLALVISSKPQNFSLILLSFFILITAGFYFLMKFIDALKLLKGVDQIVKVLYITILSVFGIASFLGCFLIALATFKDFLEKLVSIIS